MPSACKRVECFVPDQISHWRGGGNADRHRRHDAAERAVWVRGRHLADLSGKAVAPALDDILGQWVIRVKPRLPAGGRGGLDLDLGGSHFAYRIPHIEAPVANHRVSGVTFF